MMGLRVRTFAHIHRLSIAEQSEEKRGRVRRARDRRRRRDAAVHGVGRDRVDLGGRAGRRVARADALLLVAADARDRRLLVVPLSSSSGRSRTGSPRRTTRPGRASARCSPRSRSPSWEPRSCAPTGWTSSTFGRVRGAIDRAVPGGGPRALPVGHAVPALHGLLRAGRLDRGRAGRELRAGVGTHVRQGDGVPVPRRHVPARVHRPARRSTARRRPRSRDGGRSWRSSTSPSRSSSRSRGWSSRPGALSVRAEDVEYPYREGGPVLHGISLDVEAGEHVAIVGETGCGKTTFVKLRLPARRPGGRADRGRRHRSARDRSPRRGSARSGWCRRTGSCSTRPCARTCAPAGAGRPTATSRPRSRSWGSGDWVGGAPAGAGHAGRRARGGAVRRRAPARGARPRAHRRSRPADPGRGDVARWIRRPSGGRPRRCAACPKAGRRSRWRTGCRRRRAPTGCSCSTPAGWWRRARTRSSSRRGGDVRAPVRELARQRAG